MNRKWSEASIQGLQKRANVVRGEDVQWMTGNKANMRQGMEKFPFLQMYELSTPEKDFRSSLRRLLLVNKNVISFSSTSYNIHFQY